MADFMLYIIFLIGIVIATVQDLKRREVDNWLNFFMLLVGCAFIVYLSLFDYGLHYFIQGIFVVALGFGFANLFYYAHVFAGGDAKLLWALSPLFVGFSYFLTFSQFLVFIIFLFVCGGVYGLLYSLVLYGLHFKRATKVIGVQLKKVYFYLFAVLGIVVLFLGFLHTLFLVIGILLILSPFLYAFAKGLEEVVMKREVKGKDLREGDWLAEDVHVGSKVIKATFDGVSREEMALLKNKRKVLIKDGIPFVPSFLFAYVLYYFYADYFVSLLMKVFVLF